MCNTSCNIATSYKMSWDAVEYDVGLGSILGDVYYCFSSVSNSKLKTAN